MPDRSKPNEEETVYIYRWSFRHPATGQIIRPKNGRPFRFPVKR